MSPHTDAGALLPCPFCGSPAMTSGDPNDRTEPAINIHCSECNMEGGYFSGKNCRENAIKHWNARQAASQGNAGGERCEVRNESAVAWRIKTPTGYVRDVFDNEAEAAREADGYWKGCIEPLYSHPTQALKEPIAFIAARLTDLAEANALYGKDQRLGAPDKVARNGREISWLKDLRSLILTSSSVPSENLSTPTESK